MRSDFLTETLIKRANIIVKGLVQGVSFRAYTRRRASSLGLVGYVRNLSNGDVEIIVEGTQIQIYQFIKWLRNEGSPASDVSDVQVKWANKLENFNSFRVIF
ncbi:MAG: acylphosphatase [Candidatus Heimdallarchaeota archaeon]